MKAPLNWFECCRCSGPSNLGVFRRLKTQSMFPNNASSGDLHRSDDYPKRSLRCRLEEQRPMLFRTTCLLCPSDLPADSSMFSVSLEDVPVPTKMEKASLVQKRKGQPVELAAFELGHSCTRSKRDRHLPSPLPGSRLPLFPASIYPQTTMSLEARLQSATQEFQKLQNGWWQCHACSPMDHAPDTPFLADVD